MPTAPTFPGVYIEEVPSGVRTIVGVSTSTAAFIDFFERGPSDVPIRIFSYADFERIFGGLHRESEASYAIQQFFLNGGTEAYVVRVGAGSIDTARVTVTGAGADMFQARAGRRVAGVAVDNPGRWGNSLRIEVDYDTTAPTTTFNLTVSEVGLRNGRPVVRQTESFRNLTMEPNTANYAVEEVNERSALVQLNRETMAALSSPWPRPDATGTLGALLTPVTIPADGETFQYRVDQDGTGGSI
ncbi:MAG: phage tail protein, partial [Gemmatimonadota bacterium]